MLDRDLVGRPPLRRRLGVRAEQHLECTFGALGTALMASVAVTHPPGLLHSGASALPALNDGFKLAFAFAFPAIGVLASIMLGPATARDTATQLEPATSPEATRPHEPEPPV